MQWLTRCGDTLRALVGRKRAWTTTSIQDFAIIWSEGNPKRSARRYGAGRGKAGGPTPLIGPISVYKEECHAKRTAWG